jgi:hypothetical protein
MGGVVARRPPIVLQRGRQVFVRQGPQSALPIVNGEQEGVGGQHLARPFE